MSEETIVPSGSGLGSPSSSLPSPPSTQMPQVSAGADLQWFRNDFRLHFDEWVFGPIDRLLSTEDALIAFIVMACAIDYLAGFWKGKETTRSIYKSFIDEYFPTGRYDSKGLYGSLRNGLVHMFTIKGKKYALTHGHPELHLKTDSNGQVVLNAADFRNDLVGAKERYFNDVEANSRLLQKVVKRYNDYGLLDHIPITVT